MKKIPIIGLLYLICVLTACESEEDKAQNIVETFAEAAKDTSNPKTDLNKLYPGVNDFKDWVKLEDLSIDNCSEKNGAVRVNCTNSYYDDHGNFRQDKVSFDVGKNKQGDYVILRSKNLIQLPKEKQQFGVLTGAITDDTTDAILATRIAPLHLLFIDYLERYKYRLKQSIVVKNFSWYYDWGTPKGEVTIENTLPFDVYNVKYHIEYTYGGSIVGTDEGLAVSSLKSGERTTFTFYSYKMQGKNARRAQVTFSLPETLAKEWMMNDTYTGNEYADMWEPRTDSIGVDKKVKTYF